MSDENSKLPELPEQPTIVAEVKIPRILLEIFIYGVKEDNDKIKKLTDNIQNQLYKPKLHNKARILYYVDGGEKTIEEKKQWLIDNCKCKYYVFANCETYTAKPDYVKNILFQIRKMDTILLGSKQMGIFVSKNKPKPEEIKEPTQKENSPLTVVK
jgi:hypothetical protein